MSFGVSQLVLAGDLVVIAASLAYFAWPWLKNAVYVSELLAEGPPQTLPVPVQGVSMRAVRDTFGAPRPGDRSHQGVDIFAPRGTPVLCDHARHRRAHRRKQLGRHRRVGAWARRRPTLLRTSEQRRRHQDRATHCARSTCLALSAPPVTRAELRRICTTAIYRRG